MKSTGNTCCISEHFHEVGADIFLFKPCVFLSQLAFREEKDSYKGVKESAAVEMVEVQRQHKKQRTEYHHKYIYSSEFALHIPASLFVLTKAAKLHCVGDDLYSVHTGEDKGDKNGRSTFKALGEALFLAHLYTSGLLSLGYFVIFPLDIGDITQGQSYGVGNGVLNTNAAEGCGKLTGVGGADKKQHYGDGGKILQKQIQMVEKLLGSYHIVASQTEKHMAAAVNTYTVLGRKHKNQHIVQHQKHQRKAQHKGYIAYLYL